MPTMRNYRGGYRGYGGGGLSMGFPPFTRAIKWLVIANTAVFLLMLLLRAAAPSLAANIQILGELIPAAAVQQGWVWQIVTYSFLHGGLFHILFNMLTLWMFGAALSSEWGDSAFLQFYFFCVVGAAIVTISIAYLGLIPALGWLGISPATATIGASGGVYGVMLAFAMIHGDQEFMMFPLPFMIRAKYLVAILIFISLAGAFQGMGAGRGESVAYFAHLGGAFFGFLWVRMVPRRGFGFMLSERYYGTRNAYFKWKRRRAARKFEVYMRKHDRAEYFDEYGNFRDPEDRDKKGNGESRGGWVN